MNIPYKRILYGGDYNPNQWPRDIWDEDMRYFKAAGINSATINVFSWAKLQPSEDTYCFDELDDMVQMLSNENYDIVLATSTAALPAWMFKRYPQVARTDYEGRHHKFGGRHNACPNSLTYQTFAGRLVEQLARRYGGNEHIVCWHVNNEYGGECFCDACENAFRVWLKQKYKTIEALNKAWNLEFWGHTIYEWDEIVLPNALSEGIGQNKTAFSGISIDYRRFNSDSMLMNFRMERDIIKHYCPDTPVTTNLMGTYKNLDYFKWAKEMDIVSWDSYPRYNTPASLVAMRHDLMRGLKRKPFMLMEQTPSQQNWQPYNSLKKPGQMRAQSYQAMAHGADTVQFFQLRRSVGACEKFHGAVIEHVGLPDTRVFREVSNLGKELNMLGTRILGGDSPSKVGIIFDWDNYWAFEYASGPRDDLSYIEQIHSYYEYFYNTNIQIDMIPVDADFTDYSLVIAPVLYMVKDGMSEALAAFVEKGGTLVTGFLSGLVDQSDNVHLGGYPGPLRKLAGIWVEEIDALAPEMSNTLRFIDGTNTTCDYLCDIIHLENAISLADYTSNFYSGSPAITKNAFGLGSVYYIGTRLPSDALGKVLEQAISSAQVVPIIKEKTKLEIRQRVCGGKQYSFIINLTEDRQVLPIIYEGKTDILSGENVLYGSSIAPFDVLLIEE